MEVGCKRSRGPPSRERDNWIFVSLVLRVIEAVRREGDMFAEMLGMYDKKKVN